VGELVVIVGPIASGKSTVAGALGTRLRNAGRKVAVLDLDDVVETIGGFADLSPEHFQNSQAVYGVLVGEWLALGFDVIAHGPFFEPDEHEALLRAVPEGITPRRVLLLATYEVALARAAANPDRVLSSRPDVLRWTYDRAEALLPSMPPSEWTFDTSSTAWEDVVDILSAALLGSSGPGEGNRTT
jgi:predicted kinase